MLLSIVLLFLECRLSSFCHSLFSRFLLFLYPMSALFFCFLYSPVCALVFLLCTFLLLCIVLLDAFLCSLAFLLLLCTFPILRIFPKIVSKTAKLSPKFLSNRPPTLTYGSSRATQACFLLFHATMKF
jgi:hypothetical protein